MELSVLRRDFFSDDSGTGNVFKHSKSCFAAERMIPGIEKKVFFKRNPNKDWKYTLRYLFRKPRVFRAAGVTEYLRNAGISTPAVYFCGEKRKFFFPAGGCSASEFLEGASEAALLMRNAPDMNEVLRITGECAALLRRIHDSGVYHGDTKLQNLYEQDGQFGVIDLDGSIIYRKSVPRNRRKQDLVRMAAGVIQNRENDFSFLPSVCEKIISVYGSGFSAEELSSGVSHFFERKPPK